MFASRITVAVLLLSTLLVGGYVQAQSCNTAMPRKASDSRYTIQPGGAAVLDNQTGLIWQRCSLGQSWNGATCEGNAGVYNWQSALQAARDQGNGWRLPNIKELQSLVEEACISPTINETVFPSTASDFYWTSSLFVRDGSRAWFVKFSDGDTNGSYNGKSGSHYYVRLVRSGQ